jgi:hypothetical protein
MNGYARKMRVATVRVLAGDAAALWANSAYAAALAIPPSLAAETLTVTNPSPFAPAGFAVEDFAIEWDSEGHTPPEGMTATLERESLQWVRVSELLVLPRARLHVEIAKADGARATIAGVTTPLPAWREHKVRQDIPVSPCFPCPRATSTSRTHRSCSFTGMPLMSLF